MASGTQRGQMTTKIGMIPRTNPQPTRSIWMSLRAPMEAIQEARVFSGAIQPREDICPGRAQVEPREAISAQEI